MNKKEVLIMPEYDISQITVSSGGNSVTANLHDSQIPDVNEAIEAILDGGGSEPVLVTKTITQNGTYTASSDNADGYSEVSVDVSNSYTVQDEGKVVSNGALVAQGSDTATENGTVDTTLIGSLTVNVESGGEIPKQKSTKPALSGREVYSSTWSAKTWSGLTSFNGRYIWTDGDNIYYSNGSDQYVLNKLTSTWSVKTWNGLSSPDRQYIWTDGDNIYYSNGYNQKVLDKSTSTWSDKTWTGYTSFYGYRIWTDGDNIYCSSSYDNLYSVLDKRTSAWATKKWYGLTSFSGDYVWTDGDNVYYSDPSYQYILNKQSKPTILTTSAKPKFN
jgi:signal peptidase I